MVNPRSDQDSRRAETSSHVSQSLIHLKVKDYIRHIKYQMCSFNYFIILVVELENELRDLLG